MYDSCRKWLFDLLAAKYTPITFIFCLCFLPLAHSFVHCFLTCCSLSLFLLFGLLLFESSFPSYCPAVHPQQTHMHFMLLSSCIIYLLCVCVCVCAHTMYATLIKYLHGCTFLLSVSVEWNNIFVMSQVINKLINSLNNQTLITYGIVSVSWQNELTFEKGTAIWLLWIFDFACVNQIVNNEKKIFNFSQKNIQGSCWRNCFFFFF